MAGREVRKHGDSAPAPDEPRALIGRRFRNHNPLEQRVEPPILISRVVTEDSVEETLYWSWI